MLVSFKHLALVVTDLITFDLVEGLTNETVFNSVILLHQPLHVLAANFIISSAER